MTLGWPGSVPESLQQPKGTNEVASIKIKLRVSDIAVKSCFATATHAATGEGLLFTSTRRSELCNTTSHHSALTLSDTTCGETTTIYMVCRGLSRIVEMAFLKLEKSPINSRSRQIRHKASQSWERLQSAANAMMKRKSL